MDSSNFVEIKGLTFRRGDRVIFDDINLNIPRGKITAIMGPSGTGKTTLLRLISGQLKPNAGSIVVDGEEVTQLSRSGLMSLRKRLSMLFQSGALFTDLSVFENVAFPLRVHTQLPEDMIKDLVLMKLHAVGLRGARHLMPSELSGGMTRRVALARTIALDPEMVMYDEPFAGQDPIAMGMIVSLIKKLNHALNLTSLLVSHDVPESSAIADYVCVLADGKVVGFDSPDKLASMGDPMVQQFLQGNANGPVPFHYPAKPYLEDLFGER